jgi:hypothetical protein
MAKDRVTNNNRASNSADDRHHHLDRWVIGIGATLVTAVCDFIFLWPESHLAALLLFAAWLSLLAVYVIAISGVGREWCIVAVVGLFGLALFANAIIGPNLPAETDIHGWLQPAKDPMPETGCGEIARNRAIVVLGTNGFLFNGGDKIPTVRVGTCDVVSMARSPEGILVNASVYSANGELAARVENNEWHLVPGQISYGKRPDRSTLIVLDKFGKEMLWVRFLNPRAVRVRGVFSCKGEFQFTVTDDKVGPSGNTKYLMSHSCVTDVPRITLHREWFVQDRTVLPVIQAIPTILAAKVSSTRLLRPSETVPRYPARTAPSQLGAPPRPEPRHSNAV